MNSKKRRLAPNVPRAGAAVRDNTPVVQEGRDAGVVRERVRPTPAELGNRQYAPVFNDTMDDIQGSPEHLFNRSPSPPENNEPHLNQSVQDQTSTPPASSTPLDLSRQTNPPQYQPFRDDMDQHEEQMVVGPPPGQGNAQSPNSSVLWSTTMSSPERYPPVVSSQGGDQEEETPAVQGSPGHHPVITTQLSAQSPRQFTRTNRGRRRDCPCGGETCSHGGEEFVDMCHICLDRIIVEEVNLTQCDCSAIVHWDCYMQKGWGNGCTG